MKNKKFDLEDRLIDFAVAVIKLTDELPNSKAANHLKGQLCRSGVSPAQNYGEAQAAESPADFIHKMKVCLKELRESLVSIKIIMRSGMCSGERIEFLYKECNELISIFVVSIRTARKNEITSKSN